MRVLLDGLKKVFGVAFNSQTYLNMLYHLLALPLSIIYIVFLSLGFSLGIPLVILWFGIFILAGTMIGWYGLAGLERKMAIAMLGVPIPPMQDPSTKEHNLWVRFKLLVRNPVTWKSLVFLIAKLPIGIISFTALTTLLVLSMSLLSAPVYYQAVPITINLGSSTPVWLQHVLIDTPTEAWLMALIGLLLLLVSMHILNGLAWVWGQFARIMLGGKTPNRPVTIHVDEAPVEANPQDGVA